MVAEDPDRYRVVALGAQRSVDLLVEQALAVRPDVVAIGDAALAPELAGRLPRGTEVLAGPDGLASIATEADVVVNGVVGFAGLSVTLAALEAGRRLALANKESIIAGAPVVATVRNTPGAEILPVDSEHCAVHQCLRAGRAQDVARLLLTASGGPFRGRKADELAAVGVDEALAHPTWSMGPKITVDSSTLMNKGLEVIEAHELFGVPYDAIDVVVHPQSIVHSMVEYVDGAVVAQLSLPDMRLPIGYALAYPGPTGVPLRGHRLGRTLGARVRATGPVDVPVPRPRLRGGTGRRPRPRLAQRGQRSSRRCVPRGPHHLVDDRRGGGRHPRPLRRSGAQRTAHRRRCARRRRHGPAPGRAGGRHERCAMSTTEAPSMSEGLQSATAPGGTTGSEKSPRRLAAELVAAIAAIVLLAVATGYVDLLIVVVSIIVIVMLHELGHFLAAKHGGMKVTEYFVGFGPRLWSFRRGETEYGIKVLPLGGYVKIPGMTNLEEVDPADEGRVYRDKPFHSRLLVAVAGSAVHFLLAFLLLWVLLTFVGVPNSNQVQVQGLHAVGHQASPAGAGGIRPGDIIVSVDGRAIGGDVDALTSAIQSHPDRPVTVVVDRDGSRRTLTVTPANGRVEHEAGAVAPAGTAPFGLIGVSLGSPVQTRSPLRRRRLHRVPTGQRGVGVGDGHRSPLLAEWHRPAVRSGHERQGRQPGRGRRDPGPVDRGHRPDGDRCAAGRDR